MKPGDTYGCCYIIVINQLSDSETIHVCYCQGIDDYH